MGVANNRSIAWGIANKLIDEGYTCVFTYPNDSVKNKITRLSPMAHTIKCDVSDPMEVRNAFIQIKQHYPKIDYVVHAMSMTDFRELDDKMIADAKDAEEKAKKPHQSKTQKRDASGKFTKKAK